MTRKEYKAKYFQDNKEKIYAQRKLLNVSRITRYGYHIKSKYGVTIEEFNAFFMVQKGKCYICLVNFDFEKRSTKPMIDHDHKTGKIRALLCHNCNVALGLIKDDLNVANNIVNYLV